MCPILWYPLVIRHGLLENLRFLDDRPSYKPPLIVGVSHIFPCFPHCSSGFPVATFDPWCLQWRNPSMLRMMKQTVNDGYGMSFRDGCENEQNVAYKYYKDCRASHHSRLSNLFDVISGVTFNQVHVDTAHRWISGFSHIFRNDLVISPDKMFCSFDANNQNISVAKSLFSNTLLLRFTLFSWCTRQLV